MNIFVLFGVSGVFGIKAADVRADTGVCPYRRMNKQKCHVNLLQEILEKKLRKYLVMCGLFCNFAVAMRGMKACDLRVMAEPVAVANGPKIVMHRTTWNLV